MKFVLQRFGKYFKIDKIGIHSGFFELGGFSLLAVTMIIRIEKGIVGIRLPLTTLVEQNTIQKLSTIIEEGITPTSGDL